MIGFIIIDNYIGHVLEACERICERKLNIHVSRIESANDLVSVLRYVISRERLDAGWSKAASGAGALLSFLIDGYVIYNAFLADASLQAAIMYLHFYMV